MKVTGRVVFDLVLLAGAAWGLWQAWNLPPAFGVGQIGPAYFPGAVLVLAAIAILGVLWQDLKASRAAVEEPGGGVALGGGLAVCLVGLLLGAYIALLDPLGFPAATTLFLFASFLACTGFLERPSGRRDWALAAGRSAAIAIAATALSFVVFTYGFGLIFP